MNQILFDVIWTGMNIRLVAAVLALVFWILRSIYKKKLDIKEFKKQCM